MKEEQPPNPDLEDLFKWGKNKNPSLEPVLEPVKKPEKDDLGWDCPQCELNNGWCKNHPRPEPVSIEPPSLSEEQRRSSDRIADLESELQDLRDEENRPSTPQELEEFFERMNQDLFGKAS